MVIGDYKIFSDYMLIMYTSLSREIKKIWQGTSDPWNPNITHVATIKIVKQQTKLNLSL